MPVQVRLGVSNQSQQLIMKKYVIITTVCLCILICGIIIHSKSGKDDMSQLLKANIDALTSIEDWNAQKVLERNSIDRTETLYFHRSELGGIDEIVIYSYTETTCVGIGNIPCTQGCSNEKLERIGYIYCTGECH